MCSAARPSVGLTASPRAIAWILSSSPEALASPMSIRFVSSVIRCLEKSASTPLCSHASPAALRRSASSSRRCGNPEAAWASSEDHSGVSRAGRCGNGAAGAASVRVRVRVRVRRWTGERGNTTASSRHTREGGPGRDRPRAPCRRRCRKGGARGCGRPGAHARRCRPTSARGWLPRTASPGPSRTRTPTGRGGSRTPSLSPAHRCRL
mmetsp:Transcript_7772/g.19038  ORF Transcript_7772/g.19038 Transcript_7772/m.19038 type:complete len:208 (+) Transcript_7772:2127-2750(+)